MPTPLLLSVDKASPVSLYKQVASGIEAAISSGALSSGDLLQSESALSSRLRLSLPTIRQALDELVRSGVLVRQRGIGTRVVANSVSRRRELSGLIEDSEQSAHPSTTEVLSYCRTLPDERVRQALGLRPDDTVHHFTRLRRTGGETLAILEDWVRDGVKDLDEVTLRTNELGEILRDAGVTPKVVLQRIGASTADANRASLLQLNPGMALVSIERVASDATGRPITYGKHSYRADRFGYETSLVQR
ncbi:GntR family transcriptional regulator [Arthrobacter pascens]|nr:GntR family transcriptional regulator [Arthrobacter pascens]